MISKIILVIILIIAFWVRTYRIENPVADWHSWRQADTAAVARNFYQEGYNPFIPKYDDMSGVAENPIPNPNRYRFVEFPVYNSIVYLSYLINEGVDEKLARYISIVFSMGSTIFIYLISRRYFGEVTGMISAFLFATLPFNIYFSRVILPEPSLIFYCLGMFYFLSLWIDSNKKNHFIFSVIFTSLAFLTKPSAIFYLIPLIYPFYQKEKRFWPIPKRYWLMGVLSLTPFLLWRVWIMQHPEGIPASNWLFNGTGIRFRPAFFRWIIGDRFGREILTVAGSFLFLLGLLIRPKVNEGWLMHLLALSSLLYLLIFATGNVQHDYYQVLIVPALVIFTARGFVNLSLGINQFIPRLFTLPLAIFLLGLTLYLGWYEVKGLFQINNGIIVEAGKKADQILPQEAIVIAPYNGDTSFLYQVNRPGWPIVSTDVESMKNDFGVTHFVSVTNDPLTAKLRDQYQVIYTNDKYWIIDLTQSKK